MRSKIALCAVIGAALAAALFWAPASEAQVRLFGRAENPDRSVLAQVREGAFAERCNTPVEGVTEEGPEAYDLIDTLTAAPVAARYGVSVVPSRRVDAELNRILAKLMSVQPPPPGVAAKVEVQNTEDIDARQVGAGQILLTLGLVNAVRNRPEGVAPGQIANDFAFILAHEYAHVLLCHYNRSVQVSRMRSALRTASVVGALAATATNSSIQRTSSGVSVNTNAEGAAEDYVAVMAGLTILRTVNSSIVNPSWGRQQERDADWLAVELMMEAGFDPSNVAAVLEQLHQADERFRDEIGGVLSVVPAQAVGALALSINSGEAGRENTQTALTVIGINASARMFQAWRTNQLRHFHDKPDKRTAAVANMVQFRQRGTEEEGQSAFAAFDETFSNEVGATLVAAAEVELNAPELISESNRKFAVGDVEGGCAAAQQALAAAPQAPGALFASGQCELKRGGLQRAARHFTQLERSAYATPEDFMQVSYVWVEADQRARAEASLRAGGARFGADGFYVSRMQLAARYGEVANIDAIAAECAGAARTPETRSRCADEAAQLKRQLSQQTAQQQQPAQPATEADNPLAGLLRRSLEAAQQSGNRN